MCSTFRLHFIVVETKSCRSPETFHHSTWYSTNICAFKSFVSITPIDRCAAKVIEWVLDKIHDMCTWIMWHSHIPCESVCERASDVNWIELSWTVAQSSQFYSSSSCFCSPCLRFQSVPMNPTIICYLSTLTLSNNQAEGWVCAPTKSTDIDISHMSHI